MNILIVDDHAIMRHGCHALLKDRLPDIDVLEADSAEAALQCLRQTDVALLLLDIALPGMSGLELLLRLRQRQSHLPVLFYSMFDENSMIRQALEAGANGYLSKRSGPAVLLQAVRTVLAGNIFLEHQISMRLLIPSVSGVRGQLSNLTAREFSILVQLAQGNPTPVIADNLHLSIKTVANNLSMIKGKLGVGSMTELIHLALAEGLAGHGGVTASSFASSEDIPDSRPY
ncbi:response regulator transcription factor [Parathalassolituus penaei]|uniref:Response regulator transcription factor n=1 Tax=Parathalassolituus penaei TaxID=2997323 RepID=A0A9X3IS25_9GAMM|nr:response regulator transcription factor [Parathalassolituus penaei]MCY0963713.1 response regulator transcription factor [Parathalassolituus penaei]